MTIDDKDVLNEIAGEDYDSAFGGDTEYSTKPKGDATRGSVTYYEYKVWNPNPQNPGLPKTPGVVMTTVSREGDKWVKSQEIVEKVRCVILFTSSGRKLSGGKSKNFQAICQSHDGLRPSLRIAEPLCRKVSAEDHAKTLAQWKGYDAAKVEGALKEQTEGGKLAICGLKSKDGFITLCPYSKDVKDKVTGQRGVCVRHIFIKAYDVDRKREFKMELTGGSIENNTRFISPFHEFFKFLRTQGPVVDGRNRGIACYNFILDLSSFANGNFFIANFKNYKPIEKAENRQDMKTRAERAKADYEKDATRLSKEEYEKHKKDRAEHDKKQTAQKEEVKKVQPVAVEPTKRQAEDAQPVSFEDDDVPF